MCTGNVREKVDKMEFFLFRRGPVDSSSTDFCKSLKFLIFANTTLTANKYQECESLIFLFQIEFEKEKTADTLFC